MNVGNFDFNKITGAIAKRIESSGNTDLEKLILFVFESKVKSELEKADFKIILESILAKACDGFQITDVNIDAQVIEAFISKQDKVVDNIANKYVQLIAEKVKRNDLQSIPTLSIIKRLSDRRVKSSAPLQEVLLDCLKSFQGSIWQELLSTIIQLKNNFTSSKQKEFDAYISELVISRNIDDVIFFLTSVLANKGNFDISKIAKDLNQRIKSVTGTELELLSTILSKLEPQAKKKDKKS